MRLQDDIDFTTLTWVKAELDETLKQARHALEAYVEDPTDASQMRFCATYLHQVQGTLRMVELYGAAMVTEEMEHLASALLENDVKERDDAYSVLMRGIVQLPDYLERLQTGHKDIPIVLLPLLNDLRAARGEKSLSEIVLFTPDLTRPLPASAKGPLASLPELELRQVAEQLRGQFQLALLNWFRNADADANVARISQVCDKLVAIVSQEEARRLFWVAAGVMEALRAKAFEPSPQLKQTIGKVEREIKRLADVGEASFRVDPPRELTRNLLYFVAHAPTEHGRIGELRQVFRLDSLLPTEAEIAHARGSISGHNRALLDTVSVAIKEDLMRVKDALDLHLRTQNASPDDLAQQVEVLDRVSDTLGMLGLGVARRVVQEQRTTVHQVATGARPADEATLLDIAGALLYVEASLDDQVQHLGGGASEDPGGRPLPQVEARKVLEVVVKEAQANFAQAKQCFVAFVESNWDHDQLQDVPRLLDEVSGAMRILELVDPPQYLFAIRRFTESELLARRRVPNGPQMDTLADALASLEYYLEAVREHRSGRERILDVTRNSLETLGYWPVPEAMPEAPRPVAPTVAVPTPAPEAEAAIDAAPSPVTPVEPAAAPTPAPVVEAPSVAAAAPMPAEPAPLAPAAGALLSGFEGASDEIDEEIREVFVEEVQEEIANLRDLLPVWERDPQNLDQLKPIRRVFHTLKGSGRLVGAMTLGEFSWKIENMLNRVLDKTIQPSTAVQALIGHASAILPQLLAALRGERGVHADIEGIKAVADRLASGEQAFYQPPVAAAPEPVAAAEPQPEVVADAMAAVDGVTPEEAPAAAMPEPEPEPAQPLVSIDPVLFDILKAEVAGHLETIDAYLDHANAAPTPATDALLRAVHTMNGAFAMTDVPVITDVIGPLEGYIKRLLAQGATPGAKGLALIADASEAVRLLMIELEAERPRLPELSDLAARIVAERDALPEPVGPSVPLHLEIEAEDEIHGDLTEAVSMSDLGQTMPTGAGVPAETAGVRTEDSFPSFAIDAAGIESEPAAPESSAPGPVSADALVDAFAADALAPTEPAGDVTFEMPDEAAAVPASTSTEPVLDEEPAIRLPELSGVALDFADFDAALSIGATGDADRTVEETASESASDADALPLEFDELHIDTVRADEPLAADEADRAGEELLDFEAELLSLGELDQGADAPLEFEILEAPELDETVAFDAPAEAAAVPTRADDAELAIAAFVDTGAPTPDDTSALDAMIAAFEVEPQGSDVSTTPVVATNADADTGDAFERVHREAAEQAAREAAEAELAEQARLAAEAEQAEHERLAAEEAARAEAAAIAEREAAEADEAAAAAAAAEAAETAAREAAEAEARQAQEAADAAAAKEAAELAELEAEIAALEAAEAEAAREAAAKAEADARAAAERVELPEEPLADFAAETEADEAEDRAAAAAATAVAATLGTSLADADPDPDGPLQLADMDEDLLDIFLEEGGDILDHSDGVMARLRENPGDRELVVDLQRDLHTLKGGARMAGIAPIGDLGHAMESLLEAVAEGKLELSSVGVETLERAFDRLHGMVTRVGERRALAMPTTLIERVEALGRGETLLPEGAVAPAKMPEPVAAAPAEMAAAAAEAPAGPGAHAVPLSEPMPDEEDISVRAPQEQVRIRADLLDRLVNYAGEVAIYRARLEQQLGLFRGNLGELDQTTTRLREQLRKLEIETEAQIVARYQREAEVGDSAFDPLELDRFSTLQQLSRALSESAADIVNLQTTLEDHTRQYETLLLQQSRVSSELQEGLMRTRMVPFDSLVPRLRRIIRQTAGELGKKAQLKVEGAQGEMDRNVLDRMTAPLEHMLRNALAHGLEAPGDRVRAGKPDEGTVKIAVRREGSEVVIVVSDDGRGLDRDAIRAKALERGLMKPDAQLSDRDLYGFILETGFSTAQTVSKIAGRGVGMDVVHSEIRQLGGSLYIESERGKGSEFVVRLPFTLAVTQAVFVKHGDTSFAVPISSVQGVARIDRAALEEQLASGAPTFRYAGEDYSIYDLGLLIGTSHVRAEESLQVPLLLARSGDLRAAICVDQVIGSREIVVKPVGPQVSSIPGIFGATIMGDGRVIVILDVAPLVRRSAALRKLGDALPPPPAPVEQRRIPLVMVVDDSITMRKVTGRVLERHNYEVITAKDGVDAIEKLQERIPDVMLLDIEMPRMDGYELATHMRNDVRLRGIPIIMITSRTGEKHRQRAFEIGVDRYLGKPYQENDLMRNVQEILKVGRGSGG
jgi:chemosensory pili system protein ChpA (sensor histidine kinase/response regulator)